MSVHLSAAQPADYAEVIALLNAVDLPNEGVQQAFGEFLVARNQAGELLGCVGQERSGQFALLRSLAVAPNAQGQGLGRELVLRLVGAAQAQGVTEMVLLTTTAQAFFARHFGFFVVERQQFDLVFAQSQEWHLPRCSSAVCMHLSLLKSP